MTIESPSRTAAIGPPRAASGEMWPIRMPCDTPEKRPSVISATSAPSPRPCNWIVSITISGMPGPPTGPTLRTTITVPGSMLPARIASMVSASDSNTRAVPRNTPFSSVLPDSFSTQLSGAMFPFSTLM